MQNDSILVNTYDNHVTDYTQEMAQKKMLCMMAQKCHHSILRLRKSHCLLEMFFLRDRSQCYIFKIVACTCFGVNFGKNNIRTVNGACNSISGITERFMRVRTNCLT